jgi:hypothetical protein
MNHAPVSAVSIHGIIVTTPDPQVPLDFTWAGAITELPNIQPGSYLMIDHIGTDAEIRALPGLGAKSATDFSVGDWLVAIDTDSDGDSDVYRHIHHDKDAVADTNPIGTVLMYASMSAPAGYLLCDGSTIPSDAMYNQLRSMIGSRVPDLRNQFVRGANSQSEINGFTKHGWTTGRPRNQMFRTSQDGYHYHYFSEMVWAGSQGGGPNDNIEYRRNHSSVSGDPLTTSGGAHYHNITGGGDSETSPDNVRLAMIIKAHN